MAPAAQARAKQWYQAAIPNLAGLDKVKAEKALAELASVANAPVKQKKPAAVSKPRGASLVIFNTHNYKYRDRGTTMCNIVLSKDGKVVDQARDMHIPWLPDQTPSLTLPLKSADIDLIRIEITGWQKNGGGLAEVQLMVDGENLLLGKPATTSTPYVPNDPRACGPTNLTDGIIDAENQNMGGDGKGYWLLPRPEAGWVEIQLGE